MWSRIAVALTLAVVLGGLAKAETAREKQHRTYEADKALMARRHQIYEERKAGKLTHDQDIKETKAAFAANKKARAQQ